VRVSKKLPKPFCNRSKTLYQNNHSHYLSDFLKEVSFEKTKVQKLPKPFCNRSKTLYKNNHSHTILKEVSFKNKSPKTS
jgi:hypothetical protein